MKVKNNNLVKIKRMSMALKLLNILQVMNNWLIL